MLWVEELKDDFFEDDYSVFSCSKLVVKGL